ncbi:50S ribosomal protein L4 [Candidatus Pacearchaeota archaeon]|nr:50S ribosomal protein L4 [Candidatus Pacearchaeota archaeon]
MATKAKLLDVNAKEKKTIELPKGFSRIIREDIVAKVLEALKKEQPYSPAPEAGRQHSASGKLIHRRHVWKSQYGRGMSRIPRKTLSRRGSQFHWEGAEISSTVGGRKPHSPKVEARKGKKTKINKKEFKIAKESALSATANPREIIKRYNSLKNAEEKAINAPFIVDSKITSLKTKDLIKSIKKILGNELFKLAVRKRQIRSGKGKRRGRKYKSNAGLLIVIGNNEELKTNSFEVVNAKELGVADLARGGLGRITVYTEKAIEDLSNARDVEKEKQGESKKERKKGNKKKSSKKKQKKTKRKAKKKKSQAKKPKKEEKTKENKREKEK